MVCKQGSPFATCISEHQGSLPGRNDNKAESTEVLGSSKHRATGCTYFIRGITTELQGTSGTQPPDDGVVGTVEDSHFMLRCCGPYHPGHQARLRLRLFQIMLAVNREEAILDICTRTYHRICNHCQPGRCQSLALNGRPSDVSMLFPG